MQRAAVSTKLLPAELKMLEELSEYTGIQKAALIRKMIVYLYEELIVKGD